MELAYPGDTRGWLKRGLQDYYKLRRGIRWALGLPLIAVYVLLGPPLLLRAGEQLSAWWGIEPNAPVLGQPHGIAWLVSLIVAIVVVSITCGIVGTLVTIGWLVVVRRWTVGDAYGALMLYRYPRHWIDPSRM